MNQVYIVSKCMGHYDKNQNRYLFNFKGIYQGHIIDQIDLETDQISLEIGEEYLVLISQMKINQNVLCGKAVKIKKLFATFPH